MNEFKQEQCVMTGYECPRCAALAHRSENLYASDCVCMYAIEDESSFDYDVEYCVCECINCWKNECPLDSLCWKHAIEANVGNGSSADTDDMNGDDENIPDLIDIETGEIVHNNRNICTDVERSFDFSANVDVPRRIPNDVFCGIRNHVEPSTSFLNALRALQIRDFSLYFGDDIITEGDNENVCSWDQLDDNDRCAKDCNCNWCSTDTQEVY